MRIAIGVITRGRPRGLARLFESLGELEREARASHGASSENHASVPHATAPHASVALDLEVILVRNEPPRDDAPPPCRLPMRVLHEPRTGIPFARNKVLDACLAEESPGGFDALAFVDDDETVEPDWLARLAATLLAHDADAATGPALPHLPEDAPAWAKASGGFDCLSFPTGTLRPTAFTHNVLVRVDAVRRHDLRFDERMAFTGGSDTHFFRRLARGGGRIVWCEEAICREWAPASRLTRAWVLQRFYRVGATDAWIALDLGEASRPGLTWLAVRYLIRGPVRWISRLARGAFAGSLLAMRCDVAHARGLLATVLGLDRHEEYRVHHGDDPGVAS
jgi:succinoglycan biosynthesis protein ExoM